MLYVIKDVTVDALGHVHIKVIKILQTDYEVFEFLKKVENLKLFKGDIKIDKVVL